MTRYSILASVALAAGLASAAPTPVAHGKFDNFQVANAGWSNWEAAAAWFSDHPGFGPAAWGYKYVQTYSDNGSPKHSKTRTKTMSASTTTSEPEPTPTSTEEVTTTTSVAPEPTPEPTSEPAETSPAPSSTEASSTEASSTTEAPTTTTTTTAAPTTTAISMSEATTTPSAAASSSGNADIDAYLKGHNDIRAQHGADPLTWADDLAAAAATWAGNCVWEHSQGKVGAFGENLAAGTSLSAADAIKMWTDEASEYDPANPQYSHFTQVVWKATTEVGCAVKTCTNLLSNYAGAVNFHVCEYRKPGNVIGQFAENVQA